jgi:PAS domain S-box-containing protein
MKGWKPLLPAATGAEKTNESESPMATIEPTRAAPVSVLVVDDQPENRVALKAILGSPDYRILEASSEREALRHLLHEDVAVILLDVVMPEVDGFELASLIKQRERAAAVPIIFLTAQAIDSSLIRRAYGVGAADYLIKPLLPEMVRAKVAVFAELYRQRRRIEAQSQLLLEAERSRGETRIDELRLASDRRYRKLAEAVPHIVWTAQGDGRIDYFNRRWYEYSGLSHSDCGGSWLAAVHPDDREACETLWQTSLSSGQPFEIECRLRRGSDGSHRWFLCRALPEHGLGPEVNSWLGTFTDIEDQKHAQQVLAEFKGMLDALHDAVLIFDAGSGQMLYVNQAAGLLLGYSPADLMKLQPLDVVPELVDEDLVALLTPTADGKVSLETRCRRKDGSSVPVELALQHVSSNDGRIIAIARNITERKQAEEVREYLYQKSVEAVQARDEFLSVASHELRTPLTSLNLQIEGLLRGLRRSKGRNTPPPEMILGKLDVAARQVGRLRRLIEELLDVSRISTGQFNVELETVDLAAMAKDMITRFADDAKKADCPVLVHADASVTGQWDRLRVEQVMVNLFTNALKFGAGKPVELTVSAEDDAACLIVRDHGIGVPEEAQARIFERFERAPSAQGFGGLGLGLYIAQRIVTAHGGRIQLTSFPGKGAAFTVTLPLAPAAETAPAKLLEADA